MKTVLHNLALAGLVLLSAGSASAGVTVAFSHPEQFREMPYSPSDRDDVLKDLSVYFAELGARLPPGQDLRVEVLDFGMAGHVRPNFRGGQELRVLRGGADWPTMHLRYTLTENGQVIGSGEEDLKDMLYMDRINRYADGDRLRYEKRMIDDWFSQKFAARKRG